MASSVRWTSGAASAFLAALAAVSLALFGCSQEEGAVGGSAVAASSTETITQEEVEATEHPQESSVTTDSEALSGMTVAVGGRSFEVKLADTVAARALQERLAQGPLTIETRDYGGFEKVGELGFSLDSDDERMTTSPGDIVLYAGDQIVFFYGSNTWEYTLIGHVEDTAGWEDALSGEVASVEIKPGA